MTGDCRRRGTSAAISHFTRTPTNPGGAVPSRALPVFLETPNRMFPFAAADLSADQEGCVKVENKQGKKEGRYFLEDLFLRTGRRLPPRRVGQPGAGAGKRPGKDPAQHWEKHGLQNCCL